jgi:eukaryotic-like serine/threonine-protein kinase
MTPDMQRVRCIFLAAVENHTPSEWAAYLDEACAGDPQLRQRVEVLLRAHEQPNSLLDGPAPVLAGTALEPIREGPGSVIGPYKLLEKIGEGGFGIVFMALQQQPVRRKVALKIVKPGMDTRQVVARFEAERQALALMDHPNIARVFDGGETASGRPYFVMELVPGIPITEFCDHNELPIRARLELYASVCQAVQHAHLRGIIHRDLKPSNVLVTLYDDKAVVKVIDFGIAKATGQQLTEKTLFTNFAQMIGTPLYMSPEQAQLSGLDIDTRSDIYSLGVLLYELLTGTTPFDKERLRTAAYDEIRRIIREEEPARPSTRISTLGQAATGVSAKRQSDPRRLAHLCRGELDWIVMKALEKDRNRRYESASALAADVQRYLHDEPVHACPPSAGYRFRRFARRHKAALTTAAAVSLAVLLTLAGLAISTVLVWRANQELSDSLKRERTNSYYQRIALAEREWLANNLSRVEQLLDACPADLRGWEWHYLKRQRLTSLAPLRHPGTVLSAEFSPDGRWIATGSQDGTVYIWDAVSGEKRLEFQAHQAHVRTVTFSPDGHRLATASWDGTCRIWDFDPERAGVTPSPLHTFIGHDGRINSVAFSPDGERLASAGYDESVRVWDAPAGRLTLVLRGHAGPVWCVAYSPDGRYLASAGEDKTVRIWDARTGREEFTLAGHSAPVLSVAFSREGQRLASASGDINTKADGEVKVWDLQTGAKVLSLHGHVWAVFAVAFSPDGQRLASAGLDNNIKLWDLATGQEVLTLRGHSSGLRSVAFSRDGNRLISASHDRTVRLWDATPLEGWAPEDIITLRGHDGGVRSVAFSPDGRSLASAGDDGTVRLWDFARALAGVENPLIQTLPGDRGINLTVAFSKDGRFLASGGSSELRIWDARTWKESRKRAAIAASERAGGNALAFSPDSRWLAAGAGRVGTDFPIQILDAASGRLIHTFKGHGWLITALAFSPDPGAPLLVSASLDSTVRIWDVTAGKQIVAPLRHGDAVWSVAFSRDGRYLASGSFDRRVKIWDAKTWQLRDDQPDPTGGVQSVAFHPGNDRVLAWGGTDSTVKLWNAAAKETRTLHRHKSWVESIAFSANGEWLASASLDGTIKLSQVPSSPAGPGPPSERLGSARMGEE